MDVKPKGLLRRLVDLAVSEIERRARTSQNAPWLPSEKPATAAIHGHEGLEHRMRSAAISEPLARDEESAGGSANLEPRAVSVGVEPGPRDEGPEPTPVGVGFERGPHEVGLEPKPVGVGLAPRPADTHLEDVASLALDVTWLGPNEASVRWELAHEDIENARALGHETADLTLRTVSFRATQTGVMREVSDRQIAGLRGEVVLARLRERRMIVSVGLLRAEEFCSIAHVEVP